MTVYWTLKLLAMLGSARIASLFLLGAGVRSKAAFIVLVLIVAFVVGLLFDVSLVLVPAKVSP